MAGTPTVTSMEVVDSMPDVTDHAQVELIDLDFLKTNDPASERELQ